MSVAEQTAKERLIVRSGDDQDVCDPREHQCRQRVIDHRLVVNGEKLLRNDRRDRMQSRARSAGENDSFPHEPSDLSSESVDRRNDSTEQKASHVCPPRHAGHFLRAARAGEREKSVQELHEKPYGKKKKSADLRHRPINNKRKQCDDARARTKHEKCAEDSRDAARRADRRHRRMRKKNRVRETADRAANKKIDEVAEVAEHILNGAAENPEINHVAEEMYESAVQEERRDERQR